ncbi:MAG: ATP-binding cassette domain-containing protein, partial [Anaerolineae bacterium]|nr:ATP-binding cassette domain-containing protein [Anaerolineae bacterium]
PKQLSGGQRQRVAVGRAIVRHPQVFLMDEPLSNLDAKLRVEARAMISRLHHRLETTFIYVTHDQVEAMTMGMRIAVLRDGLLQQLDTPQNLYDKPDNMFVAGFIGSPAMNFFDATLVGTKEEMYVDGGTFKVKLPGGKAASVADYLGKEVVFGVRPEDIHDRQYAPPGITAAPLTVKVDVTELMGNEIFVYLLTGQKSFIARVDPRTRAVIGQDLDVVMNMDNVHIFDRQTEGAIR